MASVFISYARDDAAKAKAVSREIERAGFDVWMDQRISSGSEFAREIEQALAGVSCGSDRNLSCAPGSAIFSIGSRRGW